MSLITRCPACGTMFKVVADQLKIAQGWVRCGHCAEVFDASAQLQAGEPGMPPAAVRDDRLPEPIDSTDAAGGPEEPAEQSVPLPLPAPEKAAFPPGKDLEPLLRLELKGPDAAQDSGASDFDPAGWKQALARREEQQFVAPLISESAPDARRLPADPTPAMKTATESGLRDLADRDDDDEQDALQEGVESGQEVSFVRDARRKAFWKKSLVRRLLGALLLLLCGLLAFQWVAQHKDRLAALNPHLTPALQAFCAAFQCEIRPPRQIESLVIDSSTFNKTGTDTYRLSFTLKNSGDTTLEVPSLELTLTDTQDQAVVRRILSPRQFGVSAATLAAHSELAGVVSLKVAGDAERPDPSSSSTTAPRSPLRVAGYRILAFYP